MEHTPPNVHDKVQCLICNNWYKMITKAHLTTHNLTTEQYLQLHPNAELRGTAHIESMKLAASTRNESRKGVPRSQDVRDKISAIKKAQNLTAWNKGVARTEEQKAHSSKIMKDKYASGSLHWNTGNTTPESVKHKISQTALSQNRTYSTESLAKRTKTVELKKLSGWIPPGTRRKGIKITDPEVLRKVREASNLTNARKSQKSLDQIENLCIEEKLTIREIEDNYWIHLTCNVCSTDFQYTRQIFRPCTKGGKQLCPTCYPRLSGTSIKEIELQQFISSIYKGRIVYNDRLVLKGKELDVYLPDLGIAFEFDGLYWHSENNHSGHKHHILYKQQYAYKCGVRIVNIFEDEWDNRRSIVESRIRQLLNVQQYKLHARKCTIKEIDTPTKNKFLEDNHIMGKDSSGIRYGAYYGDLLVGVMTFTPSKFTKGGDGSVCELNRFAILQNYHVNGLASKMFKHFVSEHNPESVISYCDRRWNAGDSYNAMGFDLIGTTPPSYWYMNGYKFRQHRSNYMKHLISSPSNNHLTEWEIMQQDGYDRIWDCGTLKFEWQNPTTEETPNEI